jgi:vacuolar-type H+-ATPase subunit I/STV1
MRVQAVVEIMPRSVVFAAVLLDEDELIAMDELELATDDDELEATLELVVATDELLFELETAVDELDTATEELDFELDELVAALDEDMPVPEVGMEHSLALLLGIGSEPKVATLQLKEPFNTL